MRFSGWTKQDIAKLGAKNNLGDVFLKEKKISSGARLYAKKKGGSEDYVGMISEALDRLGIEHVREYRFLHDRRFRFDIAIPEHKIAIEFEGGIWNNGRHTRGKGYASDVKKYNLAVMHGWRLLRYTSEDLKQEGWAEEINQQIKKIKKL